MIVLYMCVCVCVFVFKNVKFNKKNILFVFLNFNAISIYVRNVMYYIYVEYKSTYTTYSAFVLQK